MTQEPVPFSVMMKSFLVIKPPFITYTKKEAPRRQQMNTGDIFGSTFFPMTNLHNYRQQHQEQEPDALIEDDLGSLFDQNFKQFIEKYIQEPYRNTADTLTNVLHKNCRLPEQLKSLASIYLMLENDLMHSLCEVLFTQMDNNENWFDKRILNSTFAEACETSGYDEIIYMELKERNNQEFNNKPVTAASYLELIDFKVQVKLAYLLRFSKRH
jgi:gamma-tubulin complex component 5